MAKRDLSNTQRKIVDRYYEHRETIATTKLAEMVSELYLAEGKKAEGLWGRVEKALAHTDANPAQVKRVLSARDVAGLAELVNRL